MIDLQPRPALVRALLTLVVALFPALPAGAQQRPIDEKWLWAGAGAMFAGSLLLDRPVEEQIPEGGGTRLAWASHRLNYGGRPQVAAVALGATWAGAKLAGSPKTAEAVEHVAIALLASGVANGTLKVAVGRERPEFTDDPHRFRPINGKDRWQSFPSGHSTVAFSLAAAISEEAREPLVSVATYGTAALVGWSRIYDDRHWTSDVVAGAVLGIVTSRYAIHRLHAPPASTDSAASGAARVTFALLPGGAMIRITH